MTTRIVLLPGLGVDARLFAPQLEAFAAALNQGGADEVIDDDDDGGDGSEEGGGAADQIGKTRRSSKDMLHG